MKKCESDRLSCQAIQKDIDLEKIKSISFNHNFFPALIYYPDFYFSLEYMKFGFYF